MDSTQETPASTSRSRRVGGEQRCMPLTPAAGPLMPRGTAGPSSGVIAAKLAPYRLPQGSIPRAYLVDLMRTGRHRALTLVSAPAGYGKTTVLTEWAAAEDPSNAVAWVSLDAGDADPARLWTHI